MCRGAKELARAEVMRLKKEMQKEKNLRLRLCISRKSRKLLKKKPRLNNKTKASADQASLNK